ncbi:MAG TPA: XRE family transcriptional regulator [Pyrinomonadaceae bacterium]
MNELTKNWLREFQDKETRQIYAENFLNTFIATQLKVLREDREWTQQQLAEETGMKQERVSVLEDVNYESWTINTLKRFARAFDLRLSIKFESFSSLLTDHDSFSRENLNRLSFDKDPVFHPELAPLAEASTIVETTAGRNTFRVIEGTASDAIQRALDFDRPRLIVSENTAERTPVVTREDTGTWQKIQKIS